MTWYTREPTMSLSNKKCVPCEGGIPPLLSEEIEEYLGQISEWSVVDNKKITKELVFENFAFAMAFVNGVAEIAETENHHPDILIHDYKNVTITLSTHAIGGLSENDFIVAAKIDELSSS